MNYTYILIIFSLLLSISAGAEQKKMKSWDCPNIHGSILIAEAGNAIKQCSNGLANASWQVANSEETRFRIGSISKPVLASLVMEVVKDKKLSLDDTLGELVGDSFGFDATKIKLIHLLSHTSGIVHFPELKEFEQKRATLTSKEAVLALFSGFPLLFEPGTRWAYSNGNYVLLAHVLEEVTGESLNELLEHYINRPAGCAIHHEESWQITANLASPYYIENGQYFGLPHVEPMARFGAGSLVATSQDLYSWFQFVRSRPYFTTMIKSQIELPEGVAEAAKVPENYGFGWFVGEASFGMGKIEMIEHGGSILGYQSVFRYYPEADMLVIALSNSTRSISNEMSKVSIANLINRVGQ